MQSSIEMNTDDETFARIRLYDFTKGKQTFYQWQAGLMPDLQGKTVLELGAGNGNLWQDLLPRCENAEVLLTDISKLYLNKAKEILEPYAQSLKSLNYDVIDFNQLDLGEQKFDVIIANHNLFYADDLDDLLATLSQHILPGGALVCSTVGTSHLHELIAILRSINADLPWSSEQWATQFGLENGYRMLSKYFDFVDQYEFDNNLHLRSQEPIFTYLHKTMKGELSDWVAEHEQEIQVALEKAQTDKGYIRLTPQSGFFVAHLN
ncbi:class I SAM-dependent methyltransferase [Reinekea sp.]|jgi:2-polyprenyl-3-methyl-5-hydroxy-6-metoxy-1,4-benzoquinol methylase|uniref:class I SAM-dependent methyltransferase n=1 Tax=Reinekea sp. TaxID=1970455 RepID=UPI003988BBCF